MRTTDNNWGCPISDELLTDLKLAGNQSLSELVETNPGLLLFPGLLGAHGDRIGEQMIYSLNGKTLTTGNLMGFIGINDTQLTVSSRFQRKERDQDHFLHYLLQQVFALNIFDFKVDAGQDDIWDIFLFYLFPYFLNTALNQGLYKAYRQQTYNDANVRGKIDIAGHLKHHRPFMGRIAYTTREHTYDNQVTELIRHTIHYMGRHPMGSAVLGGQAELRINISQIVQATPGFQAQQSRQIMELNRKKVDHPFYTAYEPLRKLCLQILRREGLSTGREQDQVFGLVFDGAWLWEEYLNTLLAPLGYVHPQNKLGALGNPIYVFNNQTFSRFPDFYHRQQTAVLDAKYKPLFGRMGSELGREDLNQLIAYLYNLRAPKGAFIYPHDNDRTAALGKLNGYGGEIFYYGMRIPSGHGDYAGFQREMKLSEKQLTDYFKKLAVP